MADQILNCVKTLNSLSEVIQYDISYQVENADAKNNFCVVIAASEMTDPTDVNEAKTLANAKALSIKSSWIQDIQSNVAENVESAIGEVTLE